MLSDEGNASDNKLVMMMIIVINLITANLHIDSTRHSSESSKPLWLFEK